MEFVKQITDAYCPHLSSFLSGDLLLYTFAKEGKEQYKTFTAGHSRIAFNISSNADASKAFSVSMDRQVCIELSMYFRIFLCAKS